MIFILKFFLALIQIILLIHRRNNDLRSALKITKLWGAFCTMNYDALWFHSFHPIKIKHFILFTAYVCDILWKTVGVKSYKKACIRHLNAITTVAAEVSQQTFCLRI